MKVLSADGIEIAFETIGEGPPLILLHGFASSRQCWRDLGYAGAFAQAGRRVILIDARGHGQSCKPRNLQAYRQRQRAADVIAVMNALGIARAGVFGYSMGGWTGIGAAQHHPDRIDALIVCGAHGFEQSMEPFRRALAQSMEGWVEVMERLLRRRVSETVARQILANDLKALRCCVAIDRENTSAAFCKAAVPLLAIAGEKDPLFDIIQGFSKTARGTFMGLPGRNHLTSIVSVNVVAPAVLQFLSQTATVSGSTIMEAPVPA